MLTAGRSTLGEHSSNLLFMRRKHAAHLLLSLADNPSPPAAMKNLLMDALYQLPTEYFIAEDWHTILTRITDVLLQNGNNHGARMPTHLTQLLSQLHSRLQGDS